MLVAILTRDIATARVMPFEPIAVIRGAVAKRRDRPRRKELRRRHRLLRVCVSDESQRHCERAKKAFHGVAVALGVGVVVRVAQGSLNVHKW